MISLKKCNLFPEALFHVCIKESGYKFGIIVTLCLVIVAIPVCSMKFTPLSIWVRSVQTLHADSLAMQTLGSFSVKLLRFGSMKNAVPGLCAWISNRLQP